MWVRLVVAAAAVVIGTSGTAGGAADGAASASPVIVAAGDIACPSGCEAAPRTAALIGSPNAVLALGDLANPDGTTADFAAYARSGWGATAVRNLTRPVPGNRDYHTTGASAYFQFFTATSVFPKTIPDHYSYTLGNWRLIALDSNCGQSHSGGCGPTSAQTLWLKSILATNTKPCVLAYWHTPRFASSGQAPKASVLPWWNLLYQYHADVVLNGHHHYFEEFAPQTPTGTPTPQGVQEFIVGTGGDGLHPFGTASPNSLVRIRAFGVLRMTIQPDGYTWRFQPVSGVGASGAATCHDS